jgi:hypothetical protein
LSSRGAGPQLTRPQAASLPGRRQEADGSRCGGRGLRDGTERNRGRNFSPRAPIVCTIAVKPTPSIALAQRTVDLSRGEAADIWGNGRHDPAIPPRIVPVAEVMVALVLADHLLYKRTARL